MNYLFPLTYLTNGLATTFLLLGLGLAGESLLAADVGLVQGATLATFYAFSGNARNLILHAAGAKYLPGILSARLLLALPLSALALLLCVSVGGVAPGVALALVLRRCGESFSEVHLSVLEREDKAGAARRYLLVQVLTLTLALSWALARWDGWLWVWLAWALVPLLSAAPDLRRFDWLDQASLRRALPELFPHLGSTAIIGVSIYAFRLLILLLGGKALAGDLFTAFALGSFAGSVFANVLGPSLAWHHTRTGERHGGWLDRLVLPGLLLSGGLALVIVWLTEGDTLLGRAVLFWEAVGWSLVGGAAMLIAQRLRLGLLQGSSGVSVFGADMMINFLLLIAIPLVFTLLGGRGLVVLYAVNAALCLIFYASAQWRYQALLRRANLHGATLVALLSALLLAPIFLQIGHGLYRGSPMGDLPTGNLLSMPMPMAVPVVILGIILLGRFRRAQVALSLLFVLFMGMLLATVLSTGGQLGAEKQKLVLLLQFLLPVLGLVLGQMLGAASWRPIAAGFLICLMVVVPWQLLASWTQGQVLLSHDLGFVSVHHHRQYVPVMMVIAYLGALFSLSGASPWRSLAHALAPLVALYVVGSTSVLATLALLAGASLYGWRLPAGDPGRSMVALLLLLALGYFALAIQAPEYSAKFSFRSDGGARLLPDSFQDRLQVWLIYLGAIAGDISTIAFGHPRPPAGWAQAGAHNYYLDFVYHFGVFALLPLLYLAWFTCARLWRARAQLGERPEVLAMAVLVGFLLVADNGWKLALRQPYSGVLTFFFWGLLLARIERLRAPMTQPAPANAAVVSHAH